MRVGLSPWLEAGEVESWVVPECDLKGKGSRSTFFCPQMSLWRPPHPPEDFASSWRSSVAHPLLPASSTVVLAQIFHSYIPSQTWKTEHVHLSLAEVRLLAANRPREASAKPRNRMEEEIDSVRGAMSGMQQRL